MSKPTAVTEPSALAVVRQAFRDGSHSIPGDVARALGFKCTGDSVAFGDEFTPLALAAGRSPGFRSDPIDVKISDYLDGTYGAGRWRSERPPHAWEEGGDTRLDEKHFTSKGKKSRDALFAERAQALEKLAQAEAAAETARLKVRDARRADLSVAAAAAATRELDEALKAYERAYDEACTAKAAVTTRQLRLQDLFRYEEER